jgi:SAM-dependent methyltransferase
VRDVAGPCARVVDLGCGPGSLMEAVLDALPQAEVWGIDFDPAALLLARARLAGYGGRAHLALADLRTPTWRDGLPDKVDAVISATALHWLRPAPLAALYGQVAVLLRPGGLFLNADHVGSDWPPLQVAWERYRAEMRAARDEDGADEANKNSADANSGSAEPWDEFWTAYTSALGTDATEFLSAEADARVLGGWKGGVEQGLPLAWHFDALREAGFDAVDCFWRCDCDAIYGGIKQGTRSFPRPQVAKNGSLIPTHKGGQGERTRDHRPGTAVRRTHLQPPAVRPRARRGHGRL